MSRANLWSRSLAAAMSIINLMSFRPNWYVSLLGSCEGNKMKIMWETEKRKIDREREWEEGRDKITWIQGKRELTLIRTSIEREREREQERLSFKTIPVVWAAQIGKSIFLPRCQLLCIHGNRKTSPGWIYNLGQWWHKVSSVTVKVVN